MCRARRGAAARCLARFESAADGAMRRREAMNVGRALFHWVAPWIVPVLALAAWEASARAGWLSTRILPEPLAVAKAAWALMQSGEMWTDVKVSTWRAL